MTSAIYVRQQIEGRLRAIGADEVARLEIMAMVEELCDTLERKVDARAWTEGYKEGREDGEMEDSAFAAAVVALAESASPAQADTGATEAQP